MESSPQISKYEHERLANIERNKMMLAELGLEKEKLKSPEARPRKYKKRTFDGEVKRSYRLVDKRKPVYNFGHVKKARRCIEKLELKKRSALRAKKQTIRSLISNLKSIAKNVIFRKLTNEEIDKLVAVATQTPDIVLNKILEQLNNLIEEYTNFIDQNESCDGFEVAQHLDILDTDVTYNIDNFDIKKEILSITRSKTKSTSSRSSRHI